MNNLKYVFGLPVYHVNIKSESYEKENIKSQIEKNYNISNIRNNWDSNENFKSNIHHSHCDEKNKKFNTINYFNLSKIYEKVICDFFKELEVYGKYIFKYEIVNYTCSKHNSFMGPHLHSDSAFSLVHYLNYDSEQHLPTIFRSPYYFTKLMPFKKELKNMISIKAEKNSWLHREWTLDTKEDDIVIFPGIFEHYVRNLDSEKLRITISVNIYLN